MQDIQYQMYIQNY